MERWEYVVTYGHFLHIEQHFIVLKYTIRHLPNWNSVTRALQVLVINQRIGQGHIFYPGYINKKPDSALQDVPHS